MKLGLALLAIGAAATRISAGVDGCYEIYYDDWCELSYEVDYCSDECGYWFYAESWSGWEWVTCDEYDDGYCP